MHSLSSVRFLLLFSCISLISNELINLFSFIYISDEFYQTAAFKISDSFLQKTRQKYNSTRALASRLNLADMTTDLNLHPPSYVKMSQLEPPPSPSPKPSAAHTALKASSKLEMPNGILANGIVNKDDTTGGYLSWGFP